jgi:hypothetical protein
MDRYTSEDTTEFIKEEEKRHADEMAAYFAWKRGETPVGEENPMYASPTYTPPEPSKSKTDRLFDSDEHENEHTEEIRPIPLTGAKIDIDSLDLDDISVQGRQKKLDAMAHELEGFRTRQQREVEQHQRDRVDNARQQGKTILDRYGKVYKDTSKEKPSK